MSDPSVMLRLVVDKVGRIQDEHTLRLERVETRLDHVEARLKNVEERLGNVETKLDALPKAA